jgi:hypothetical protein
MILLIILVTYNKVETEEKVVEFDSDDERSIEKEYEE